MERIINRIGGLIISPKDTVKILVHERRGLLEPLMIVLLFSIVKWTALSLAFRHLLNYMVGWIEITPFTVITKFIFDWLFALGVALGIIYDLVIWILFSLGVYMMTKLVKGSGDFEDTMAVIGYAHVSKVFMIIPLIMAPFAPVMSLFLSLALYFVSLILLVYITAIGVSEIHGLSFEKAIIVTIIPPLVVIGFLALSFILAQILHLIFPYRFMGWG